jgi:ATP citrate (pro-S)-lyase
MVVPICPWVSTRMQFVSCSFPSRSRLVFVQCATADPDHRARALIVGGGIANFTDVAATFNGIIKAFREKQDQIKAANMRIFVRRGGPNYKIGLQRMKALGEEIAVPIEVRPGGQEPE